MDLFMKLTTLYYRHLVPAVTVLFVAAIVSNWLLIRRALQHESDGALRRSRGRIEQYVRLNHRLPEVTAFDDQQIRFIPVTASLPVVLSDTMQFIPEQKKNHISRKLSFPFVVNGQPWEVTITQPLEGTRHIMVLVVGIAIATIAVTLLLFVLINRRVLSSTWRPFYRSLDLIRAFKVHNPDYPRYPDSPIEEFRLMNSHFSRAAANAGRDYRNLKEFNENASHELQTPLAIMRANLDMLVQEGMTERQSELMQGAYGAIRRMSRLQESLLLLTRIDNRQFTGVDVVRIHHGHAGALRFYR